MNDNLSAELKLGLLSWCFSLVLLSCGWLFSTWWLSANNQIPWGVKINDQKIALMSQTEAQKFLKSQITTSPVDYEIIINNDNQTITATSAASLGLQYDYDLALNNALEIAKQGNFWQQAQTRLTLLWQPISLPLTTKLDSELVAAWATTLATQLDEPGHPPIVKTTQYSYEIDPGKQGEIIDQSRLVTDLLSTANKPDLAVVTLAWQTVNFPLKSEEIIASETRLKQLWPKKLLIQTSDSEPIITIPASQFFNWLDLRADWQTGALAQVVQDWKQEFSKPAQNAIFEQQGNQLIEFEPDRPGRTLSQQTTEQQLAQTLNELETQTETTQTLSLNFTETPAEITLADTNNLGITDLLGVGTSTFFHSIANRVHNVALTSERLHATLVAPGKEFSFNQAVGEINSKTGYKTAYVIRNGRTELGDGGGVCQASTTTFRAALAAGMKITAWKAHSYRVGYYEQNSEPGFDATVYSPSTDFRFLNDTENYIVVASYVDTDNLFMRVEIWGTKDGRKSEISNYKIWNQRPAPASIYQDDPTLPRGTTRQVDWAAPGASTSFDYTVTDSTGKNIFQKTFVSNFKPWQAVYLVGTQ